MISVLTCIGQQHDPWLVAVAAAICGIASFTALRVFRLACGTGGPLKAAWLFFAALVAGAGVWCTHFVAILAYRVHVGVAFDPTLMMVSLLIAIGGVHTGFAIASVGRWRFAPPLGGGVTGLAIAAMHYTGMMAYRLDGIVQWQPAYVVASVLLAAVLGMMALPATLVLRKGRLALAGPALLVAAILTLHFTAMTAIRVIPLGVAPRTLGESADLLAAAIALVALIVVLAGHFASVIDTRHRQFIDSALAEAGLVDRLTGLPNGDAIEPEIQRQVKALAPGDDLMVAIVALSRFHEVIEHHGGKAGRIMLRHVAQQIAALRKPGFFLARIGLAEFCAIGPVGYDEDLAARVKNTLTRLPRGYPIDGLQITVSPRVGIARLRRDGEDAEGVMHRARLALGRALETPGEVVAIYDSGREAARLRRLMLSEDVGRALERGEFELVCQPQVTVEPDQGGLIGYEVLLRWRHSRLGMIAPDEFVPLAEATGDILAIGQWVLAKACATAARWPQALRIAVNVSPLQLQQDNFYEQVADALAASALAPDRLEIEITESLLISDSERARGALQRLRALGVRLALDDFGTGYSSMGVLRHVPFDTIKLDKSFVADIVEDADSRLMLQAVVAMAATLTIPVLAEGVETEAQMAILRASGCSEAQGYLIGRPIPISDIDGKYVFRLAS